MRDSCRASSPGRTPALAKKTRRWSRRDRPLLITATMLQSNRSRLHQRLVFFAKAGVRPGEEARQLSRIDRDNRVGRWFHGRDRARESIVGFVGFPGKLLAETEQRQRSGIVRHG